MKKPAEMKIVINIRSTLDIMKSSLKVLTTLIALFSVADIIMLNLYTISWFFDIAAISFFLLGYFPFKIESLRIEMIQRAPTAIGLGIGLLITNVVGVVLSGSDPLWEYWIGYSLFMNLSLLGWILGLYHQDRKMSFLSPSLELDAE